jgi:hypothetical protein
MSQIGQIDCGYLAMVQGQMDILWTDPIANIDLISDVEIAKAVLGNQSVNFTEILGKKKRTLSVEWLQKCTVTTDDCSDDCDIDGEDVEPQCKEYDIECLQETSFKVADRVYRERTVEKSQAVAKNMLLHMKAMDEWVAAYITAQVLANAGTNQYTGSIGTVAGALTTIPAQYWDDQIWGYFNRVIRGNKFKAPYLVTGDNLFQLLFNRQLEQGTMADKGGFKKIGAIGNIYVDPENIEAVAPGSTFLIHKTAAAFLSKAWNPLGIGNATPKAGVYALWSEPSRNIPGIYYDIAMKETCESNDFTEAYKIQLHGLFAMNPYPCNEDITGILNFECE